MSLEQEPQESPNPFSHDEHAETISPDEEGMHAEENMMEAHSDHEAHFQAEGQSDSDKDPTHKKRGPNEGFSAQFAAFKKLFDENVDFEAKLQLAIDYMEASLAQGGTPHFRSFWEARRLCLPLFKENISPNVRSLLWTKYSELSKEARRLKEILDEQSAFAVEQIEIAIVALENDIAQFHEQVEKSPLAESFSLPQALKAHAEIYHQLQKQLNILNTQASRINALRKELLKTEMRVRHKNKFFQRLSSAGDLVFPKRKELIKQISQQFSDDVDHFIKKHFGDQPSQESLYLLREEIKSLQGLAKVLTLNTHSFTHTRSRLSECWDLIKSEEKERKKERAQQRTIHKQNFEEIEKQIQTLKEALDKNIEPHGEAQKKVEGIVIQMRKVELGRDEIKLLRERLNEIRNIIHDKMKSSEEVRKHEENERERQKKEKYRVLREQVEQLVNEHEPLDADQLISNRDALVAQIQDSSMSKIEKQELERLLKPLRDIIAEKKEKALMALSDDDRQALQQLKTILQQRKERRQEVKTQLENLRKAAGSSSLDFEKAMNCKTQINEEKERLEKANQAIQEIENKIVELQAKLRG